MATCAVPHRGTASPAGRSASPSRCGHITTAATHYNVPFPSIPRCDMESFCGFAARLRTARRRPLFSTEGCRAITPAAPRRSRSARSLVAIPTALISLPRAYWHGCADKQRSSQDAGSSWVELGCEEALYRDQRCLKVMPPRHPCVSLCSYTPCAQFAVAISQTFQPNSRARNMA